MISTMSFPCHATTYSYKKPGPVLHNIQWYIVLRGNDRCNYKLLYNYMDRPHICAKLSLFKIYILLPVLFLLYINLLFNDNGT